MSLFKRILVIAGVLATVGVAAIALFGPNLANVFGITAKAAIPSSEAAAIAVVTEDARSSALPVTIASLGTVTPLQSVPVRSRIDGEVLSIDFKEGDRIKAGDVIATIDPDKAKAALEQAKAKKAQDAALLVSAESDLKRYQDLAGKGYASQQLLEQKVAADTQLRKTVDSDSAAIDSAQADLGFATIRAPLSGRVGFRNVDRGSNITANATTGIVTIIQMSPIAVVFSVPGARFGDIREAMVKGTASVEARTTDNTRVLATGKLTVLDNTVDTTTGAIRLKAEFANDDEGLWPGLVVATRLILQTRDGVVVSDKSLLRGQDGLYAFVVGSDNRVSRRKIDAPVVVDGKALVLKGIAAGEKVVSVGTDRLGDGTLVAVDGTPTGDTTHKKVALETLPAETQQ